MKLTSAAFIHDGMIPPPYTCDEQDISPPFSIEGVPAEARSLALIVDDPDAPSGDFVHWVVFDIVPETQTIMEGSAPVGSVQGTNDMKKVGWGGPCPPASRQSGPAGIHHYQFKLYALDTFLYLQSSTTKKQLLAAMDGHVLNKTVLVGRYQRS